MVLEPRIGVVVIEVLSESKSTLLGALRGRLCIELDGTEEEVDSPLLRAETLAASLRAAAAGRPVVRHVPFVSVAVFPRIDRGRNRTARRGKSCRPGSLCVQTGLGFRDQRWERGRLAQGVSANGRSSLDGELDAVAPQD